MSRGRGGPPKEHQRFSLPPHQGQYRAGFSSPTFYSYPRTPRVPGPNPSITRFQPPSLYSDSPEAFPRGPTLSLAHPTPPLPGLSQDNPLSSEPNGVERRDEAAEFRLQQVLFLKSQSAQAPKFREPPNSSWTPQHQSGYHNSPKTTKRGGFSRDRHNWEKGLQLGYPPSGKKLSGWEYSKGQNQTTRNHWNHQVDTDITCLSTDFHSLSLEGNRFAKSENFDTFSSCSSSGSRASSSLPAVRNSLQLTPDIQKQVLSALASLAPGETIQARVLARKLHLPKKIVNQALYALANFQQVVKQGETPPLWSLRRNGDPEPTTGTDRPQCRVRSHEKFDQETHIKQEESFSKEAKPDDSSASETSAAVEASCDSSKGSEDSGKESSFEELDSEQKIFSSTTEAAGFTTTMEVRDNKELIRQYLYEAGNATALLIAKNLGLRTAKQINSTLYAMEKHGELRRDTGRTPPAWELTDHRREKMDRQRKASVAVKQDELELLNKPEGVPADPATLITSEMVGASGLSSEPGENMEVSKEAILGNGTFGQKSHADMDGLEQVSPDPTDLSSCSASYSSAVRRTSYYHADDRNGGGQSQWASDEIPEYLNTIRSEVAVSLAAPPPPVESSEAIKLQKLREARSKNPVSGLMEYAQYLGYNCEFLLLEQSGPSHDPRLEIFVYGSGSYTGFSLV